MNKKIEKDTLVRRQVFLDRFSDFPLRYGGWAISEDFAYDLVQYAMFHKPKVVLDLGTGTTTALLGKVAQKLSKIGHEMRIVSVDSDKDWLNDTENILKLMGVDKYVDLVYAPIIETEKGKYYDFKKIYDAIGENKIDLMTIDGPPKTTQKEARYPAMPFFEKFLTDKAVVLLDDGQRDDEKAIVKRWEVEFLDWRFDYGAYMRGGFIIYKEKEHQISPIISNYEGIIDDREEGVMISELSGNLKIKNKENMETITKKEYDTDKHKDLIPAYEKLFADIRNEKLKILEVGVLRGGSMLWLKEFFPNSEIYGMDIKLPEMNEDRVTLIEANQNDTAKLEEIAKIGFDIIIDDGCHFPKETQNTFNVFWKATKHYIIEDWDAGINNPSRYRGLENVIFGIIRKRHELGIKRFQIAVGLKSYAYYLKDSQAEKNESMEKCLKELTNDIENMDKPVISFEESKKISNEIIKIKTSKSFLLGSLFFQSIKDPLKFLIFPISAMKIILKNK